MRPLLRSGKRICRPAKRGRASLSEDRRDVASLSFGGGKKRAQQRQQQPQQEHFEQQQQLQHREGMNTHLETTKAPLPPFGV